MKSFRPGPDLVATILALALVVAVLVFGIAIIVNVVLDEVPVTTLGENTTQVLSGLLGGIIGVLGSYLGRHGKHEDHNDSDVQKEIDNE